MSVNRNQGITKRLTSSISAVSRDYTLSSWLFLRLVGLIYLFAFASLWPQVPGLIGQNGILPAAAFLDQVRSHLGTEGFWFVPTLAWWSSSDGFLIGLCAAGVVLSLMLLLNVLPTPSLAGLFICWLSLVNVGQDFLSFQWDVLLLEAGFLAVFLVPGWHLRPWSPRQSALPSRIVLWLLRWLLFRLMFLSGLVKLASGDAAWRSLTALGFHYETQPLPTPLAWYAHQLPAWFHSAETAAVLLLELVVPFLIFVPGRAARIAASSLLSALQILILLTGNYAFFNLLSLALCVLLLTNDDIARVVPARLRCGLTELDASTNMTLGARNRAFYLAPLAALFVVLSLLQISSALLPGLGLPEPLRRMAARAETFHIFNSYGLFAVMTTSRPEIIVEGSRDGQTWTEYPFRYKIGDIHRRPRWVWPHQPRLDWQMWFAALSGLERGHPSWFPVFVQRLLEGSPEVVGLLEDDPFGRTPPRYVRAVLYDYRFTHWRSGQVNGAWWQRKPLGTYFPTVSLPKK